MALVLRLWSYIVLVNGVKHQGEKVVKLHSTSSTVSQGGAETLKPQSVCGNSGKKMTGT